MNFLIIIRKSVGGGKPIDFGADPFGAEFPDQEMPSNNSGSMSLSDKLASKKWNERAGAYEELTEMVKNVSDSNDPLFYDHSDSFK